MTRSFSDEVIEGSSQWRGFSSPPSVSAAGYGAIHFDASLSKFRMSESGGAYQDLGTVRSVSITAPAAGITASGTVTSSGSITLALANDLAALEGLSGTGFAKRTGSDTWTTQASIDLTTDVTGALPIGNGGSGQTTRQAAFDALSPLTSSGGIIYRNSLGNNVQRSIGSEGMFLKSVSGFPVWNYISGTDIIGAGAVSPVSGGTGFTNYTTGDMLYASSGLVLGKLGIGSSGQVLAVFAGAPAWITLSSTASSFAATRFDTSGASAGIALANRATGLTNTGIEWYCDAAGEAWLWNYNTSSNTFRINNSGNVVVGGWQATAVAAAYGGTGLTSYAIGDTLYADSSTSLAKLAGNTSTTKKFLTQTGTGSASQAPVWTSPVTGWAAQSCSLSRTLLCGGSATLDNLSQVLSTLINDLRSFGVITT